MCNFSGIACLRFPRLLPVVANLFIQLAGEAGADVTLATKNSLVPSPGTMPYITIPSPSPAATAVALSPAGVSPITVPCTALTGAAAAAVAAAAAAANAPTTTPINHSALLNSDPSLTAMHNLIPSSLAAITASSLISGHRDLDLGNKSAATASVTSAQNAAQLHSLQQQAVTSPPQVAGSGIGVTRLKTSGVADASPFQDLEQLQFGRPNNAGATREVGFLSLRKQGFKVLDGEIKMKLHSLHFTPLSRVSFA